MANALAKNIPVCGYRVGYLPELLGSEETLADAPAALAALAAGPLADRTRLTEVGNRGRVRVLERFSLDAMLRGYADVYARILGKSRRSRAH